MSKLQNMFDTMSNDLKKTFSQYPITVFLIFLTSVFGAINVGSKTHDAFPLLDKAIPFCVIWGIGMFFFETISEKRKPLFWIGVALTAAVAYAAVFLTNLEGELYRGISVKLIEERTIRYTVAYCLILAVWAVYRDFTRSGKTAPEYITKGIQNLAQTAIMGAALVIGSMVVAMIFVYLLLNQANYNLVPAVAVFFFGCVAGVGFLAAMLNMDKPTFKFFAFVVKNILLVLTIVAFVIIYAYIAKIFITGVMPSNEVFRILASLFVIGLPIWTMAGNFDENTALIKIARLLPFIFIPFLALQGYSIGLRVAANGLTPLRYLAILLIVFEAIYILIYAFQRDRLAVLLPIFTVFVLVAAVIPGINMVDLSIANQKKVIETHAAADFASLPLEEKGKVAGAYYYLASQEESKAYAKSLDTDFVKAVKNSGVYANLNDAQSSIYKTFPVTDVDISGYQSMTAVFGYSEDEKFDPKAVPLWDDEHMQLRTVDVSALVTEYTALFQAGELESESPTRTIALEDGSVILLSNFSYTLEPPDTLRYLNFQGYLLKP